MAKSPKSDLEGPSEQSVDNPAEVNTTPDLTALEPIAKKKILPPNEKRRAQQLLDRIAKKKAPKLSEGS